MKIDEHGGSYSMEIIYDIRNNQILPSINSINYNEDTSKCKIYTNSIYSEIYYTYVEGKLEGCFGVKYWRDMELNSMENWNKWRY